MLQVGLAGELHRRDIHNDQRCNSRYIWYYQDRRNCNIHVRPCSAHIPATPVWPFGHCQFRIHNWSCRRVRDDHLNTWFVRKRRGSSKLAPEICNSHDLNSDEADGCSTRCYQLALHMMNEATMQWMMTRNTCKEKKIKYMQISWMPLDVTRWNMGTIHAPSGDPEHPTTSFRLLSQFCHLFSALCDVKVKSRLSDLIKFCTSFFRPIRRQLNWADKIHVFEWKSFEIEMCLETAKSKNLNLNEKFESFKFREYFSKIVMCQFFQILYISF